MASRRPDTTMRQVIVFGNPLHGDDGFGPAVYARLAAAALPADVRLIDAGTRGLDALALFEVDITTIVVDVLAPAPSGGMTVDQLEDAAEDVPGAMPAQPWAAPIVEFPPGVATAPDPALTVESGSLLHAAGVGSLLAGLAALGLPRPHVIATQAGCIQPFAPGLSPPVAAAVGPVAARVRALLEAGNDGKG